MSILEVGNDGQEREQMRRMMHGDEAKRLLSYDSLRSGMIVL